MSKLPVVLITLLTILTLAVAQCGSPAAPQPAASGEPQIKIVDSFARASQPNGAIYLTFMNEGGAADTLVSAQTDAAEAAELHETTVDDKGVAKMTPMETLDLPAGQPVKLEPGGKHLMLIGMEEGVAVGDKISLTLTFEKSDPQTIEVEVIEGGTAMGQMEHAEEGGMEHDAETKTTPVAMEHAEEEGTEHGDEAEATPAAMEHDEQDEATAEHSHEESAAAPSDEIAPQAQVFQVVVAAYLMDTAGFHDMDERLNEEGVIQPGDAGVVNRVNRALAAVAWSDSLKPQADTLIAVLNQYAEALANDDIETAKPLGAEVHEAQHNLSEVIGNWPGQIEGEAGAGQAFQVSVATYLLDAAALHEIEERLDQESAIQPGDAGIVNRVNRVLTVTHWPEALQTHAGQLATALAQYAEALSNDDLEAAKPLAAQTHDTRQALAQAAAGWLAGTTQEAVAGDGQQFQAAVAMYLLDTAGFHEMDERLNSEGIIRPGDAEVVNRVNRALAAANWPDNLKSQADNLMAVLARYAESLANDDVETAAPLGAEVHEAQHELSQAIQSWLGESVEPAGEHDHDEEEKPQEHDQPQEESGEHNDDHGN